MTSKTITSLAFAAGCAFALGAIPSAHAQHYVTPRPTPGALTSQYPGPGPALTHAPVAPYVVGQPRAPDPYLPRPMMQTQAAANAPQASHGDFGDWSARRNNAESRQYMRVLQTNMGYRQARIRKECGPINDPQLHQQCVASFETYTPFVGSSGMAGNAWYPPNPQNMSAGY